jgi:hypothetical protein
MPSLIGGGKRIAGTDIYDCHNNTMPSLIGGGKRIAGTDIYDCHNKTINLT